MRSNTDAPGTPVWSGCWPFSDPRRPSIAGAQEPQPSRQHQRRRAAPAQPDRSRASRSTASRCSTSARLHADQPELVRHAAPHQAALIRGRVRRGPQHVRRRPAEPPGRAIDHADGPRRPEDDLRVRAVRRGRGRRADDLPPPPRLWRAGAIRGGAVVEPVHGSGRLPELVEYLGTDRHGVLPQRAGPLDANPRQVTRFAARAARRERRLGRLCRPRGAATSIRARFPLPDFSGAYKYRTGLGLRSGPPACSGRSSGTTSSTINSTSRATPGVGHQPQLEPQAEQGEHDPAAVRVRRGHSELHERLSHRHRHRQQPFRTR